MKTKHFFLALMLTIVGTMQIQAYTVYYYNTSNYKFAVWSWADGVESQWSDWMTPVSGHSGWYQTTIRNNCNMVIFTSFSTSTTTPDWNKMLSQTADLTYDGVNAYYVEGIGWQNGFCDYQPGTWGDLTWTLDADGLLTLSGSGDMSMSIRDMSSDDAWNPYGDSIKSVFINNDVTNVYNDCYNIFGRCPNLSSIIVEKGNTVYDSRNNCNAIIETATNKLICACNKTVIPNTVTEIAGNAFDCSKNITSITIPNSVTVINMDDYCYGYAHYFRGCDNLTTINVDPYNNIYTSINGILINKGTLQLLCCPRGKKGNLVLANSVTSIGFNAFYGCSGLTSITIPNSVTNIESLAFYSCRKLKNIIFGASLKVIEDGAFQACSSIETITCYSQRPPTVNDKNLKSLNYSTIVYVPADYIETYKMHDVWGLYDVRPIGAKTAQTDNLQVTPQDNTAVVVWPSVSGAATYELVIKDKQGNAVCTLTFNANGQLTQIAFGAPGREKAPEQTEAEGFSFTVTGLDEGTPYVLTIDVKDSAGKILQTFTQNFTTLGATGIDDVSAHINAPHAKKIIGNGIVYILLPDGRRYNLQGTEVK